MHRNGRTRTLRFDPQRQPGAPGGQSAQGLCGRHGAGRSRTSGKPDEAGARDASRRDRLLRRNADAGFRQPIPG